MENAKANALTPGLLVLAFTMSSGMWGLLYLGAASVRSRLVNHPHVAVEGQIDPPLASLSDYSQAELPTRTRARVEKTRKRRLGPTYAARVFSRSSSL